MGYRTHPKTRVVGYSFPGEGFIAFDVKARLERAMREGVITNGHHGGRECPWFDGPPGAALRALRDEFRNAPRVRGKTR